MAQRRQYKNTILKNCFETTNKYGSGIFPTYVSDRCPSLEREDLYIRKFSLLYLLVV